MGTDDSASIENKTLIAAKYFMDILAHSGINFNKIKVVVFEMNDQNRMNNHFIDAVNILSKSAPYKEHMKNNLIAMPVADLLTTQDYYLLDQHLYSSGHEKIAKRLQSTLFTKEPVP